MAIVIICFLEVFNIFSLDSWQ